MPPTDKLPLPEFLKMLTTGADLTMQQAMGIASKIYKSYGTPEHLGQLSTLQLEAAGLRASECKSVMTAVAKAGYKSRKTKAAAGVGTSATTVRKKRKRDSDLDMVPPSADTGKVPRIELSLSFDEILDEEALLSQAVVTNRAPVMTAWAMIVGERMGFQREEALSIASAYTEMNAISKGVAIGVFDASKGTGIDIAKGEAQPYVDVMGRRIPVLKTRDDKWRALVKGESVDPADAHAYIRRAFKEKTPHVLGAMRLVAESFTVADLNDKGFGLYAEFRPAADKWGARSEMKLANILALRRINTSTAEVQVSTSTSSSARTAVVEPCEPSSTKTSDLDFDQYDDLFDAFEDADTVAGPSVRPP